jgi:hypothetical protein
VLRLQGSNCVDWKPDHLHDISTKLIVTPPDGRLGPPFISSGNQRLRYYRQAYPSLSV